MLTLCGHLRKFYKGDAFLKSVTHELFILGACTEFGTEEGGGDRGRDRRAAASLGSESVTRQHVSSSTTRLESERTHFKTHAGRWSVEMPTTWGSCTMEEEACLIHTEIIVM